MLAGAIAVILKSWVNRMRGFVQLAAFVAGEYAFVCNRGQPCGNCLLSLGVCPIGTTQRLAFASNFPFYITLSIIALIAVIFGSFFCGWVCPVGFVQDFLSALRIKGFKISRLLSKFRYVVVALFAALIALELKASFLSRHGIGVFSEVTIIGGVFILGVAVFSKRVICRVFCPYGLIYGLGNKLSVIKVALARAHRKACVTCAGDCVSELVPAREVNGDLCVKCFNCKIKCRVSCVPKEGGVDEKT